MIIAILLILGLIFGSFVNALVWRLHQQSLASKKTKVHKVKGARRLFSFHLSLSTSQNAYSILTGRSMCPNCKHELAVKDLVPVLSWLTLRGKCRYCKKPISWQYPLVELATAGLFLLSYFCWPLALHGVGLFEFVVWLVFLVAFMALTVYDLRWYLLPNKIIFPLIGLAAVELIIIAIWQQSWTVFVGGVLGTIIIAGLFWALFQLSGGRWIGGGDVKLAVVLGILAASPAKAVLVIFFASLIGTVVSLPLMSKQGIKARVPFGPFLLAATVITVLFGSRIIDWYTGTLI